mmetsp:Transcript_47256/g.102895  ORF Transcript_47256/g.102895 Transcript_47256/m.102895 type:complete len:208 (-) Transcript_47256:202-825(-)
MEHEVHDPKMGQKIACSLSESEPNKPVSARGCRRASLARRPNSRSDSPSSANPYSEMGGNRPSIDRSLRARLASFNTASTLSTPVSRKSTTDDTARGSGRGSSVRDACTSPLKGSEGTGPPPDTRAVVDVWLMSLRNEDLGLLGVPITSLSLTAESKLSADGTRANSVGLRRVTACIKTIDAEVAKDAKAPFVRNGLFSASSCREIS